MKYLLYILHNAIKKLLLLFLMLILLFSAKSSFAQLSGTFTIGSGGDYADFNAAVTALGGGVNGPVTFNVLSGTYTEQFAIGAVSGTSASNTIVFKANSGNAADVTVQYTATSTGDNYVARLNGTDFVTFQNMTITAWGTSYAIIIQITDNSDNHSI